MLENRYKVQIVKSIRYHYQNAFIQKIADRYTPGIPDLIVIIDGSVTFIELKCTRLKTNGKFRIDNLFTDEQYITAKMITNANGTWLGFIHLNKLGMTVIGWDILSKQYEIIPNFILKSSKGIFNLKSLGFYSLLNSTFWKG